MKVTIDNSELHAALKGLAKAFEGQGLSDGFSRFLAVEAGQLAWEISGAIGPRQRQTMQRAVAADVKRNSYVLEYSNLSAKQHRAITQPEMEWLYAFTSAGGTGSGIVGTPKEMNFSRRGSDAASLLRAYRETQQMKGTKWERRGSSRRLVMVVNKPVVTKGQRQRLLKLIGDRIGQSRAAWAATAEALLANKRVPAWVRKQIAAVRANGKTVLDDSKLTERSNPLVVFGSQSPGVQKNRAIRQPIKRAVEVRSRIMLAKIVKILNGYAYNWNTGQVFRPLPVEAE